jgi:hypothetical protein
MRAIKLGLAARTTKQIKGDVNGGEAKDIFGGDIGLCRHGVCCG